VKGRTAIVYAGIVTGVAVLVAGCTSQPEVLNNRPYIPAPAMQPPVAPVEAPPAVTELPPPPEIPAEPELITYTVQKGDSYWKIARQYGVSHQELAAFNQADLSKPLRVGSTLRIPPGGALIPPDKLPPIRKPSVTGPGGTPAPSGIKPLPRPADGTYTVQKGDSLWLIARKFNTTTKDLAAANNLSLEKPLQVGQKLTLPGASATTASTTKPMTTPAATLRPSPTPSPTTEPPEDDLDALLRELENQPGTTPATPSTTPATTPTTPATTPTTPATTPGTPATTPGNTPATPASTPDPNIDDLLNGNQSAIDHEVLPGETLQSVADLYGLTVEDLRKANPGLPADGKLTPFKNIKVPNQ